VGGALIVLTAFDEIQVTKVDGLQGMIRGIRNNIEAWGGSKALTGDAQQLLAKTRAQVAQALDESGKYLGDLERESAQLEKPSGPATMADRNRKRDLLREALAATKATVSGLQQLQQRLAKLPPQAEDSQIRTAAAEAIPLTLQAKLVKARLISWELMARLESKSQVHNHSQAHHEEIIQSVTVVNNRIASLKATAALDSLDQELTALAKETVPLTRQAPYTLLSMRVVEIGLPVLLGIVSLLFLLRYSLTEARSNEIKNLLKQRSGVRATTANS
jgi:hypothetical protein